MRVAACLLVVLLAGCEAGSTDAGGPAPSISPTPVTVSSAPVSSSPTPTATPRQLELRGDDLGITRVGARKQEAVVAVSRALGRADTSAGAPDCIDSSSSAAWKDLVLSFDAAGRLNGWQVNTPRLATPSGVRVGTTVATLKRVYGRQITFFPADPDNSPSYQVNGVAITGYLDSAADSGRVTALVNGACHGP